MKKLIEKIIRYRNSNFAFDKAITNRILISFAFSFFCDAIRGYKRIFYFLKPQLIFFGKKVKLINASKIYFGRFVKIGDYTTLSAVGIGGLSIGHNSGIGAFSRVVVSTSLNNLGSHIEIGNNVGIGEYAYLGGAGGLSIGHDCIIGQYLSCHPENHNYKDALELIRLQGVTRQGITIGKNCWIGSKVTILDGVSIGDNCIIAAGAVVHKNFPANSVIGGVPAKILKSRLNNNLVVTNKVA